MGRRYAFDTFMQLDDGAAAHTASGIGQVGGSNKIIDLGGSPTNTNWATLGLVGALARIDAMCVLDLEAIFVTDNNNAYTVSLMGSNNSNGSAPVNLASMLLGYGTLVPNGSHSTNGVADGSGSDTVAPARLELPFTNEQFGIVYEFLYLYITVAGTTPSIQFYNAYVAVQAEM